MYWQWLGLPGIPLSQNVEDLAKWVQWAMSKVGAGVSDVSYSSIPWWEWLISAPYAIVTAPTNEDVIRYNLQQFWDRKDAALSSASSEEERRQIYRLDMLAHGTLNAVAQGRMYSESPSYWQYWKAFILGGDIPRDTSGLASEARRAADDAAQAARQAGLQSLATYFERESDNVDAIQESSDAFWNQGGVINVAGVPYWIWGIAGLSAAYLLWRTR